MVTTKVAAALRHKLIPVICVGETSADLETHGPSAIPVTQLEVALSSVKDTDQIVVAYEPVWAIGSGQAATPEQAEQVAAALRKVLQEKLGETAAATTRVLYGGSVKSGNIASFMRKVNVDGALIGGASLDLDEFVKIAQFRKHVGV